MPKHVFALRMTDDYRPFKELYIYETDNERLTIDDFVKINSNTDGLALMYPFYVGFGEWRELVEKHQYKNIFSYKLQFTKEN